MTLDQLQKDDAVLEQVKALAGEISKPGEPTGSTGTKSGKQLGFKRMAPAVVRKIGDGGVDGQKALATSGSVVVGQEFDESPIELGRPANSLLSVLPTGVRGIPEFAYIRQTVRTNDAAVVAAPVHASCTACRWWCPSRRPKALHTPSARAPRDWRPTATVSKSSGRRRRTQTTSPRT
jgi:hypothetical protein